MAPSASHHTIKVFVHECTEQVEEAVIATINQDDTASKSDWFPFVLLNLKVVFQTMFLTAQNFLTQL